MAARIHQRTTDKDGIGNGIHSAQFPDGIKDEHVGIFIQGASGIESAAPHSLPAAIGDDASGNVETIRLSRR